MATLAVRRKRCKVCNTLFTPRSSFHRACSPACAIELKDSREHAKATRKRENDKRKREFNWTDRQWLMHEAQKAFNRFVRLRDKDLPCISCGNMNPLKVHGAGQWDAGHYRTVGANPELRFEELNCHKQCKRCNSHGSGNIGPYRLGLVLKIGQEKIEWLEGPHEPKKYTTPELADLVKHYRAKCKELE